MDNEKAYTLKSVQSELKKLKKSRDKKREKIQELTSGLKADSKRIKELESIYDKLFHEDLQRQIATVWFKENKMTGEQIAKFLELSTKIHDRLDVLDVATVVKAITQVCDKKELEQNPTTFNAAADGDPMTTSMQRPENQRATYSTTPDSSQANNP